MTIENAEGEQETIDSTPEHPFYVEGLGWVEASALHPGMTIWFANGTKGTVEDISNEGLEEPVTVYNFEVAEFHTYFVGECGVLLHNTCDHDNPIGPTEVVGGGHAGEEHRTAIDNKITQLVGTGEYEKIYGNRALNTAGLTGTERPDIIAVKWDGKVEVYEYASSSQASGEARDKLIANTVTMQNNNPEVDVKPVIEWGHYDD